MRRIGRALPVALFLGTACSAVTGTMNVGPHAGEVPPQSVTLTEKRDDFTGAVQIMTPTTELPRGMSEPLVSLQFRQLILSPRDSVLEVVARYQSRDWMFISEAGPMMAIIDSSAHVEYPMSSGRPTRDVVTGAGVYEAAAYRLTRDDLHQLASAHTVKIRIIGDKQNADRFFSTNAFAYARTMDRMLAGDTTVHVVRAK